MENVFGRYAPLILRRRYDDIVDNLFRCKSGTVAKPRWIDLSEKNNIVTAVCSTDILG